MKAARDKSFGKRLKAIRNRLNLRQKEFVQKLDISVTTLSDIETGKTYPCHDFFYNIVKEYNVNLHYLLFGEGEMFKTLETATSPELNIYGCEDEEILEFLDVFFKSRMVQFQVLGYFRKLYNEDEAAIKKDIERTTAEKKRKRLSEARKKK